VRLELGRSVLLVGRNDLATSNLLVGVATPDDELLGVVGNGDGGELVAGAELVAPAGGNGVRAAGGGGSGLVLAGAGALDDVVAGGGGGGLGVEAEGPVALGVGAVAAALEVLDDPLGVGSHHGDIDGGRGSDGAAGGEEGGDEEVGQLHGCGCKGLKL
jgi:hypothetical protein